MLCVVSSREVRPSMADGEADELARLGVTPSEHMHVHARVGAAQMSDAAARTANIFLHNNENDPPAGA